MYKNTVRKITPSVKIAKIVCYRFVDWLGLGVLSMGYCQFSISIALTASSSAVHIFKTVSLNF